MQCSSGIQETGWARLEEQAVDHDQVADGQLALPDAARGQQHGRRERAAEDEALPEVQRRQGRLRLQRRRLVLCSATSAQSVCPASPCLASTWQCPMPLS